MKKYKALNESMRMSLAVVLAGLMQACAQQPPQAPLPPTVPPVPPAASIGYNAKALAAIDLANEIPALKGRKLRMMHVTVEPGGNNTLHSHANRPEVVYMLQGKLTEYRGDKVVEWNTGDSFAVTKEFNHWVQNRTSSPAAFIAVFIVEEP